ncbi:oligosaccharyltransferase subunit ribophorin II [Terfezia boudieri ATCC MYA-4762]|uniref:Oligosaccharyltransferase subunit ribophorin II n=1 Tax=Terfezia boudieri ATCC MYA-4762 TaxID=1051890 RepID=A0A3N4M0X9_9PEZI|nr:oligosaccharyltransferase subunit ribophorin II [Terfezia boudieri ATCC MYA-4762]
MRWGIIATAVAGLAAVVAAQDAGARPKWNISGAKLVTAKKGDTSPSVSEEFTIDKPVSTPITLSSGEALRLSMTFKAGNEVGVPHQAYLFVQQADTGIETFFPFDVAPTTAKAKLEITHKDLPPSFIVSSSPLTLTMAIGDFTENIKSIFIPVAQVQLNFDSMTVSAAKRSLGESPVVYAPLPELRHTFRPDPKNPPKILTLIFLGAIGAALVGLFGAWATLGANLSALPKALRAAPLSHPTFLASVLGLEGIFVMYYLKWNLFQTLTAAIIVGPVAFYSGSRTLREVRARRLNGER